MIDAHAGVETERSEQDTLRRTMSDGTICWNASLRVLIR